MRSRKLLALIFTLLAIAPALAGYMTLLGAGVGSIAPVVSWVSTTDPTFPSSSLTFSRTSLATMFDSTGKLTYAPNNLLLQSNTFSNAAWTKQNVTLTNANAVSDPVGGTDATTVTATAGGGAAQLYFTFSATTAPNVIQAIWIKRRTGSGAITLVINGSSKSLAVNGSWQFLSGSGDPGTGPYFFQLTFATSGDAVDIYAASNSAVTYETTPRTADQVITTSSAYYGPRIDYDPNTLAVKGLLIEEARTNLVLNSGALTGAEWSTSTTTIGSDATVDLTGATAVRLTASSGLAVHQIFSTVANVSVTNGTTYVASWNLKAGTHRYLNVQLGSSANWSAAVFDLNGTSDTTATQTGSATDTAVSGSAKYMGNGWFRVSLKFTAGATESRYAVVTFVGAATGNTFGTFGNVAWTAAGTETVYIGQPQNEAGPFATSYIPTAAASVTRAADVVQFTGPASVAALQAASGSAIVQMADVYANTAAGAVVVLGGNNATAYPLGLSTSAARTYNGSTALNAANAMTLTSPFRVGIAWGASSRSLVGNGGTVATDAGGNWSGQTAYYLGSYGGASLFPNGHYTSFAIYNQRLSDATLQAKSVVGASYAANDNVNPFAPQFAANDNLPVHWRIAL